jgi:hypothetical protein
MNRFVVKSKKLNQKSVARRNHPSYPAGTTVFAILNKENGYYYHFSYIHEEVANKICERLKADFSPSWIPFNFNKRYVDDTLLCSTKLEDVR